MVRKIPNTEALATAILAGDRAMLGRAITLVESKAVKHRRAADDLLDQLMPHTGNAWRIGITGVPGVGKSTFIESFGMMLLEEGLKVAVLAIDPSSRRTGGSILGDKTRMQHLSMQDQAFIRPSPAGDSLGGVARATRETMLLVEAAGYDVVLVETVGVGQSETVVEDMVDFFLLLMLAGAGDELQGVKRGVMELADLIAVNKADGDNEMRARIAAKDYRSALRLIRPKTEFWRADAMTCSGLGKMNLTEIWQQIQNHRQALQVGGAFETRRQTQRKAWMWSAIEDRLMARFRGDSDVKSALLQVEDAVLNNDRSPGAAADYLLDIFGGLNRDRAD